MKKPKQQKDIDLSKVIKKAQLYIDYLASKEFHEDNMHHYEDDILSETLKAIYGENVFDYINSKIK